MSEILKRILLVEDDEKIAFVAVMVLEEFGGFKVRHCDSGQKALECFDAFAPQLVLLDVMMPGMDGPETLRNLLQNPNAQHVPVVFLTAKAQKHEQKAYFDTGAVGVIVKPFDPMALSDQVRSYWHADGEAEAR